MNLLPLYLTFAVVIGMAYSFGGYKHITVKGKTICNTYLMRSVDVELWEKDTFDPDDLLNTTKTDINADFSIYGGENEVGHIEPYLRIIHNCDNGHIKRNCVIQDRFPIPNQFVNGIYGMGLINLNIVRKDRKINCD